MLALNILHKGQYFEILVSQARVKRKYLKWQYLLNKADVKKCGNKQVHKKIFKKFKIYVKY